MYTFDQTRKGYAALWDSMKLRTKFEDSAIAQANRILKFKTTFLTVEQATGVPWYMIGVMLYRESSLSLATYLGNGQSLTHKTTVVPTGRGPFNSFLAGAIDAIDLEGMQNQKPWTIEKVLYWLERFNGQGYFGKHTNDPYLWSWTNLYEKGKFTSDHGFDAAFIDPQGGCAAIMAKLFTLDTSIVVTREKAQTVQPSPTVSPVKTGDTKGKKPMADATNPPVAAKPDVLTEIENALASAYNILPQIIGFLSTFIPQLKAIIPFLNLLPVAIDAVRTVHQAQGGNTVTATSAVISHLTPDAPNAAALSGQQGSGA